jgi:hypothetical protein
MATNPLGKSAAISDLRSNFRGYVHLITIPDHDSLRIGTLNSILSDVADYLGMDRSKLMQELFDDA